MQVMSEMKRACHEQVVFALEPAVGLEAVIAIHDTTLGPALGGVRLFDYASEEEALADALDLARHMTYKAAMAGLDLGGGHAIILGDPSLKRESLFRAFGRHVQSLGGRFIAAEDMNTTVQDMTAIRRETRWVVGIDHTLGGTGDPAPVTAWGLYHGIRACLEVVYGSSDPRGRTVAIQGVGNVGYQLARYLHESGCNLVYSDFSSERLHRVLDELGGKVVEGDDYYSCTCDVLAPCAVGGVINRRTIPQVTAPIICGGANNLLEREEADSEALVERGITHAPDYVVNSGGLMSVHSELTGWSAEKVMSDASGIFDTVKRVLNRAAAEGCTPLTAANHIAEERMSQVAELRRVHVP